jgi:hypothetical protein
MSSRDLIYLSAAFGGFFLCLGLEMIALHFSHKRIAALKLDVALATTEGKS